jgi:very-short-patch-repair endonuclease
MTASEMDRAIETLARLQHGVFNNRQAHDLGASPRMIRRRRDTGRWQQLSRTVWTLPSAPASWHRQVMAAVLSLPGSAVSGLAAGHLHGLEGFRSVRPELTVPRGGSRRSPFARVHQSDRVMRTVCGPFPVVTVEQAICDSAGRLGGRVEEVLVAAILAGRTSADAVLARAAALLPHPPHGSALLLEVASELSRTDAVPMSVLEAVLFRVLADVRIPTWHAQATPPWWPTDDERLDVLIPSWRLIVEADGRQWHSRRRDFENDRRRDHIALVHDHRTLRFTHQQLVHEPSYALEVILAVGANTTPPASFRGGR